MSEPSIITRAEAKARGLGRYFTGKPCKRNHVGDRYTSTGQCVVCILERNEEFSEQRRDQCKRRYQEKRQEILEQHKAWRQANRDVVAANNKAWYEANKERHYEYNRRRVEANPEAEKEYKRLWYERNAERIAVKSKAYRLNNSAEIKAGKKAYYEANKREVLLRQKEYYEANKEKVLARNKAWETTNQERVKEYQRSNYEMNREKRLESVKAWKEANPDKRRSYEGTRRARKNGSTERHTAADIQFLFLVQKGRCAYCPADLKKGRGTYPNGRKKPRYHVDHIMPLSKGGGNGRDNLALACPACNIRKHNKHPIDFAREQGRLL